jgi:hypothetical protein
MRVSGYGTRDVRCGIRDLKFRIPDTGFQMPKRYAEYISNYEL